MRFLVDAQLPPALARRLAGLGHDATHVVDCDMVAASDDAIWSRAILIGAAAVTKDEDFAARSFRAVRRPPIVWLRWPNMRRRDLIDRFEASLPAILEALDAGEPLIEVA